MNESADILEKNYVLFFVSILSLLLSSLSLLSVSMLISKVSVSFLNCSESKYGWIYLHRVNYGWMHSYVNMCHIDFL